MADQRCYICKEYLSVDLFNKDKHTKSGFSRSCRKCARLRARDYYSRNKEKRNSATSANYYKNHEQNKFKARQYYYKNKDIVFSNCAKRRTAKLKAIPCWIDKLHEDRIKSIYRACINATKSTGKKHHVDHIIPLQGSTVCGLHVWWNLRIMPAEQNLSKGNRSWPNMWKG
jgi:hypothetical protein